MILRTTHLGRLIVCCAIEGAGKLGRCSLVLGPSFSCTCLYSLQAHNVSAARGSPLRRTLRTTLHPFVHSSICLDPTCSHWVADLLCFLLCRASAFSADVFCPKHLLYFADLHTHFLGGGGWVIARVAQQNRSFAPRHAYLVTIICLILYCPARNNFHDPTRRIPPCT